MSEPKDIFVKLPVREVNGDPIFAIPNRRDATTASTLTDASAFGGWWITVRTLMLAGACCLFAIGCGPLTTDGASKPDAPVVVDKLDANTHFTQLAKFVPAQIKDLEHLRQVVSVYQRLQWLSADDIATFDAAFKGDDRQLDDKDAATLRGLK